MKRACLISIPAIALFTSPAFAQSGGGQDVNALLLCAGIEDPAERLACFDEQAAAARSAPQPAPVVPPGSAPAPVQVPSPSSAPAPLPADDAPSWAKAPEPDLTEESFKQAEKSREPDAFAIEIVKVTRTKANKLRFYTADGQVWEQLLSDEDWDLPDSLPATAEVKKRMVGKPVIQFDHRKKTYKVQRIR